MYLKRQKSIDQSSGLLGVTVFFLAVRPYEITYSKVGRKAVNTHIDRPAVITGLTGHCWSIGGGLLVI